MSEQRKQKILCSGQISAFLQVDQNPPLDGWAATKSALSDRILPNQNLCNLPLALFHSMQLEFCVQETLRAVYVVNYYQLLLPASKSFCPLSISSCTCRRHTQRRKLMEGRERALKPVVGVAFRCAEPHTSSIVHLTRPPSQPPRRSRAASTRLPSGPASTAHQPRTYTPSRGASQLQCSVHRYQHSQSPSRLRCRHRCARRLPRSFHQSQYSTTPTQSRTPSMERRWLPCSFHQSHRPVTYTTDTDGGSCAASISPSI